VSWEADFMSAKADGDEEGMGGRISKLRIGEGEG